MAGTDKRQLNPLDLFDVRAELSEEEMRPKPFLKGQDLIAQGLEPGPIFSKILNELEDLQLEGRIRSRQEALDWLHEKSASASQEH